MRGYLGTIFNKLFLLISRGRLLKIDNTGEFQKIQISNLANETITDIERYQEYGFENYPILTNSETISLFINGNRNSNKGINIAVSNRKLRPTDLQPGEVCIYSKDSEGNNTNRIIIKPTDEIEIKTKDNNNIKINNTGINITDKNNNKIELTSTGIKLTDKNNNTVDMNGGFVDLNGNTKKFVTYTELNSAITTFLILIMAHVHTSAAPGAPTSTPTAPITFDISAAESQKARTG